MWYWCLSTIPPLLHQPYEYYVLYCCTALLSLPLLLRSILLQVLLLFPLCCCIASATASLCPSGVPEQLPPAQKCQQHEMHPPRNRHMINMYRRKKNQTSILRAAASFLHKRSTHTTEHTSLEKHVQ